MVDLFEEVEEELRSDRTAKLARGLIPWVSGLFALVLVGYLAYWGYTAWQSHNLAAAGLAYEKGLDALAQNDTAGALTNFEAAAKAGAPGYRTLALMQEGDLRLVAGKPDEAAKLYDQAATGAPNEIFADLARLKAAEALMDTTPLPQIQARLAPLAAPNRPYALYAKEALAMAELMAGRTADARRDFTGLSLSLEAPEDLRQRAQMALTLINSGEAQTAAAAAKLAATMPPPPTATVGPQGAPSAPPPAAAGASR